MFGFAVINISCTYLLTNYLHFVIIFRRSCISDAGSASNDEVWMTVLHRLAICWQVVLINVMQTSLTDIDSVILGCSKTS